MTRKLALCFDGTWNTVKDRTNVSRLHAAIQSVPDQQLKYYDEGVGTRWYERVLGGSTGFGLPHNIRQGYAWLVENYRDGDEVYLFGFSRGAYTARSLSGLIGRCGIAHRADIAEKSERKKANEGLAMDAYNLYRASRKPDDASREFIEIKSRTARVKFIGVWDTVGALGIPMLELNIAERFHDTALGKHVDNAYHALAIDEERKDFQATLWTENPGNAVMQQRWFPGSHANVGGGYKRDNLPCLSLSWIAGHAHDCGLRVDDAVLRLEGTEFGSPVRDSYSEFLSGAYRRANPGGRYRRPIGRTVNETVDEGAYKKWEADAKYRPDNLPPPLVTTAPGTTTVAAPA